MGSRTPAEARGNHHAWYLFVNDSNEEIVSTTKSEARN